VDNNQNIKSLVQKNVRRHNRRLSAIIKNLDEEWFNSLPGGNAVKKTSIQAQESLFKAKQFYQHYANVSGYFDDSMLQSSALFNEALMPILQRAAALINSSPNNEHADTHTAQHFIGISNFGIPDFDNLPRLARSIGHLTQQNDFDSDTSQNHLRRAELCLQLANQAIIAFEKNLSVDLSLKTFTHDNVTLVHIPEKEKNKLNSSLLKRMLNLPLDHNIWLLSEKFKDGVVVIHNMTDVDAASLTIPDSVPTKLNKKNGEWTIDFSEFFEDIDPLLDDQHKPGIRAPLKDLAQHWSDNAAFISRAVMLTPSDLDDLSLIHQASGATPLNQIPSIITLSNEQRWFIGDNNHKTLTSTAELVSIGGDHTVWASTSHTAGIEIPGSILAKALIAPITVTLKQVSPCRFIANSVLPQQAILNTHITHLDSPLKKHTSAMAIEHQKNMENRGYIDHRYDKKEMLSSANILGISNLDSFSKGINVYLEQLDIDTLIDIEYYHSQKKDSHPYYASFTLYSSTNQGPHVRRVACCILPENEDSIPSSEHLDAIGMDATSFTKTALPLAEAEKHLLKAFSNTQVGRIGTFLSGRKRTNEVFKSFPELSEKLSKSKSLDTQLLIKNECLTERNDLGVTLYLDRNNKNPSVFYDTPGSQIGLRGLFARNKGTDASPVILSSDGKSEVLLDGESLYLRNLSSNTTTKYMDINSFKNLLHTEQSGPSSFLSKSDPVRLAQKVRIQSLLVQTAPTAQINPVGCIDINTLPNPSNDIQSLVGDINNSWRHFQSQYRFELSIEDNLNIAQEMLHGTNLNFNVMIASSIGGAKANVEFLKHLKTSSPAIFSSITMGKKLNLINLYNNGGGLVKIPEELTKVNIRDLWRANVIQLQLSNPDIVSHYQLYHHGADILSNLNPQTKAISAREIAEITDIYKIPPNRIKQLYTDAYEAHNKSTSSFIPDESNFLPMGNGSLLRTMGMLHTQSERYTDNRWISNINKEYKAQQIVQLCENILTPMNDFDEAIHIPILQDNGLQICAHKHQAPLITSILPELTKALQIFHIANGAYRESKQTIFTEPELKRQAYQKLMELIPSEGNVRLLKGINHYLQNHGVEYINIIPHHSQTREWVQKALRCSLFDAAPPPFNEHYSPDDLNSLYNITVEIHKTIAPRHAISKIDAIFTDAKQQYLGNSLFNSYKKDLGAYPLWASDKSVISRNYAQQCRQCEIPALEVTTSHFINYLKEHAEHIGLDSSISDDLAASLVSGKKPQNITATKLHSRLERLLRTPPPFFVATGPVLKLQDGFNVSNASPIATLLDNPDYQHCISPHARPHHNVEGLELHQHLSTNESGKRIQS
jgi:hypothetical protein